jgi:peptidoglycan/LPS O-acetylase OafA/YrhL
VGAELLLAVLKFEQLPGWMVHASSWTAIPGLLVFLAGARHARLSRFKAAVPVCRWLGQLSYPCYILHMQLLLIWNHLLNSLMPQALRSNPWFNFPVLFIPVAAVLALLGPPLERAVMQWRKQVLARPAPAAASVSPA